MLEGQRYVSLTKYSSVMGRPHSLWQEQCYPCASYACDSLPVGKAMCPGLPVLRQNAPDWKLRDNTAVESKEGLWHLWERDPTAM